MEKEALRKTYLSVKNQTTRANLLRRQLDVQLRCRSKRLWKRKEEESEKKLVSVKLKTNIKLQIMWGGGKSYKKFIKVKEKINFG